MKKSTVLALLIAAAEINPTCAWADEQAVNAKTAAFEEVTAESAETVAVEEVAAETAADEAKTADTKESDKVVVSITMIPRMQVTDSVARFELWDENGVKLGEAEEWIGGITKELKLEFDCAKALHSKSVRLKLKSGLTYLKYDDKLYGVGDEIVLKPYVSQSKDGEAASEYTYTAEACPLYEHAIVVYAEGSMLELYPRARLMDDVAMIPIRPVANALGIDVTYDEAYNSVVCEVDGEQVIFNMDTAYATVLGEDTYLPRKCEMIDDTAYAPVRALAEAFGCTLEALDFGDHIDVRIGASEKVAAYREKMPVNRMGIASRTGYMVWIDKSDFRVRVYTGSQYKWKEVKSFPCAIGAVGMETPTGSYEYEYRMEAWYYDEYYVGPCLVFWGNYAMHSTLLGYNGIPYDNRTGVKLSHGCVRLEKQDIEWLSDNLPTGSRVYITE